MCKLNCKQRFCSCLFTIFAAVCLQFLKYFFFFRDPLSSVDVKIECNGEQNGHANEDDDEDPDDPLSLNNANSATANANANANEPPTKKKRKSSAEKFLEDNSEYYGFQVLPSKLRSSSLDQSNHVFPNPFLDFLHRRSTGIADQRQSTTISTTGSGENHANQPVDHGDGQTSNITSDCVTDYDADEMKINNVDHQQQLEQPQFDVRSSYSTAAKSRLWKIDFKNFVNSRT